ncbi:MAG: hypothetical protein IH925_07275 [Proteobacteria bacterium]|nr:hypothetical protein [Pseudomonadota bacterium]MCH8835732.1 hypothetical protein [Pseudomonadota bacterium]
MNGKTVSDLAAGPAFPPAITQPFLWSYLGFLPKPGPFPLGVLLFIFTTTILGDRFRRVSNYFAPKRLIRGGFSPIRRS